VSITFGQTSPARLLRPQKWTPTLLRPAQADQVLVRMSKSAGTFWPGIRVYSPDGTKLCEAVGSSTAVIASCTLTNTGTYTILADDCYDGTRTGNYYLYLQRLNNPGRPVSITFGQTLSGSIVTPAEMDAYTFTANAGDQVLVRMSKSAGTFWPEIRVYSPDGTKLCEAVGSVTAEIASCPITNTGTYAILADDCYDGTRTGNYDLYLQRLNNPGRPVSITFGQTLSGSIVTPAEMDAYTFTASAGDQVLVRMSNSNRHLLAGIRVYGADGTRLCEAYGSVTAEIASCTLSSAGTYTILTDDYYDGTRTGNYYLYLQRL